MLKGEGLTVPYVTYDGKDSVHFFSVPDTYTYFSTDPDTYEEDLKDYILNNS